MGVHGSDVNHCWEGVPGHVYTSPNLQGHTLKGHLSAEYQTGSLRENHRKSFGDNGRVPEREHRKSFGKTEKLFRNILLGQNGFGTRLEILRGPQNWCGNFWEFSERKTENVPELP